MEFSSIWHYKSEIEWRHRARCNPYCKRNSSRRPKHAAVLVHRSKKKSRRALALTVTILIIPLLRPSRYSSSTFTMLVVEFWLTEYQ